jgi:hypothetical protein
VWTLRSRYVDGDSTMRLGVEEALRAACRRKDALLRRTLNGLSFRVAENMTKLCQDIKEEIGDEAEKSV